MESIMTNADKILDRFNELSNENASLRKQIRTLIRWFASGLVVVVVVFSLIFAGLDRRLDTSNEINTELTATVAELSNSNKELSGTLAGRSPILSFFSCQAEFDARTDTLQNILDEAQKAYIFAIVASVRDMEEGGPAREDQARLDYETATDNVIALRTQREETCKPPEALLKRTEVPPAEGGD